MITTWFSPDGAKYADVYKDGYDWTIIVNHADGVGIAVLYARTKREALTTAAKWGCSVQVKQ